MSEVKVNKISPRTNCGTVTVGDSGDSVSVTAGVPVTVNGDLKSNALKAVDGGSIISQCGTNITLGASGDTINLAAGASQTGFGRTGTVDWDTTAKTASFTAVSGNGYFVNTTSGAVTMTLPATPSAGDIVSVKDYAGTFGINNLTIARNGSNLDGNAGDKVVSTNFQNFTMVYVDGTQGWIATDSGSDSIGVIPAFVTATGGTITTCGNFKIHTFTGPGTFCVSCAGNCAGSDSVSYMVIAGGGGGGQGNNGTPKTGGGGGGAGGYREGKASSDCYTASPLNAPAGLPVSVQGYPITVGGGAEGANPGPVGKGSNSVFSTITSTGGGGGKGDEGTTVGPGGSGGGSSGDSGSPVSPGGLGNDPSVSPPQGNPGAGSPGAYGAGGGGAGAAGSTDNGGNGVATSITGSSVTRAGGGAGGGSSGGTGGTGGGGNGGSGTGAGNNGTTNTGGGGGGAGGSSCGTPASTGGSGIVVIRYKFQ
jgi:hypothetical protein